MELKSYLLENTDILKMVVDEINSFNGTLDYLEVYTNDEYTINELFLNNPYEALRSSYYGDYNFNHSLIKFNGCGNIESLSDYNYEIELKDNIDYITEELLKVYNKIDISEELKDLIEKVFK